jgi:nitrous oxide reductase accessory protein NosL
MSRCDAKKFKMEGEKMKNVKKLRIMVLVAIFATTSLAFSCQAAIDGVAKESIQLYIRAPAQVAEHYSFQVIVTSKYGPVANAIITTSWMPIFFVTDANGVATIMSPWVNQDTQFAIFATKPGCLSTRVQITVINLPLP